MNEKIREFVKGMLPGLPGKPHPMANKEPVAYLYNGVRLPKLPEWDREKYPYACIYYNKKASFYSLWASQSPIYIADTNSGKAFHALTPNLVSFFTPGEQDSWYEVDGGFYAGGQLLSDYDFVWCNSPIKENDTIVHEASEPIPVYE